MSSCRWYSVVIDCNDIHRVADFWEQALGYRRTVDEPQEIGMRPPDGREPYLVFVPVPEGKAAKNRLHIDLAPDDRDAEVERLIGLGATRVDVGQTGDETWVVLADPEGNELCVLSAR